MLFLNSFIEGTDFLLRIPPETTDLFFLAYRPQSPQNQYSLYLWDKSGVAPLLENRKSPMSSRISSLTSGFSVQQLPIFALRLSSALSSLTAVFGMLQVYPARYRHCTSTD